MEDLAGVDGWFGGGRVEESKTQEVKGHHSSKFFLLPFVCKDGYKGIGKEKMTLKIFSDFCWNNWTYHAHLLLSLLLVQTLHAACVLSSAWCEVYLQTCWRWSKWMGLSKCKFCCNFDQMIKVLFYQNLCRPCTLYIHICKFQIKSLNLKIETLKEARMAAKLLKKRFNIQNVNDWLAENDKNMDGKLKIIFILSLHCFPWTTKVWIKKTKKIFVCTWIAWSHLRMSKITQDLNNNSTMHCRH